MIGWSQKAVLQTVLSAVVLWQGVLPEFPLGQYRVVRSHWGAFAEYSGGCDALGHESWSIADSPSAEAAFRHAILELVPAPAAELPKP